MDWKTKLDELAYRKTRNTALVTKKIVHAFTAKDTFELSDFKHRPSACEEHKSYDVRSAFFLSLNRSKMDERARNNSRCSSSESVGSYAAAKQLESEVDTMVSTASTECTSTFLTGLIGSTGLAKVGYLCFEGNESLSTFESECLSVQHSFDLDQKEATMKWLSDDAYADENTGDRQQDDCKLCLVM